MDIREYVQRQGIRVEVVKDRGAQVNEDGWEHHAYILRLVNDTTGETMEPVPWMQGYGIETVPQDEPATVLDALVSDASTLTEGAFEDWASALGYDPDSRKAERTYREIQAQASELVRFLGGVDEFEHVAYEIERL